MNKKLKSTIIAVSALCLMMLFLVGTAVLVDTLQYNQDIKTLQSFLKDNETISKITSTKSSTTVVKGCRVGDEYGFCPTIRYEINNGECLRILKLYKKTTCMEQIKVQYNERDVLVHLGGVYDKPGIFLEITLNEKNLLWKL